MTFIVQSRDNSIQFIIELNICIYAKIKIVLYVSESEFIYCRHFCHGFSHTTMKKKNERLTLTIVLEKQSAVKSLNVENLPLYCEVCRALSRGNKKNFSFFLKEIVLLDKITMTLLATSPWTRVHFFNLVSLPRL